MTEPYGGQLFKNVPVERARALYDWHGALAAERDGHRVGAHAVARDAEGGVGKYIAGYI